MGTARPWQEREKLCGAEHSLSPPRGRFICIVDFVILCIVRAVGLAGLERRFESGFGRGFATEPAVVCIPSHLY